MKLSDLWQLRFDPVRFVKLLWPNTQLYREQRQIMEAVVDTPEVFVPAGNS